MHTPTAHTRSDLVGNVSIIDVGSSGGVGSLRHTSAEHNNIVFGGDVLHDEREC